MCSYYCTSLPDSTGGGVDRLYEPRMGVRSTRDEVCEGMYGRVDEVHGRKQDKAHLLQGIPQERLQVQANTMRG